MCASLGLLEVELSSSDAPLMPGSPAVVWSEARNANQHDFPPLSHLLVLPTVQSFALGWATVLVTLDGKPLSFHPRHAPMK